LAKTEPFIKGNRPRVFGLDNDGEHSKRLAGTKNTADGVGQEQLANALPSDTPRQAAYERCGNDIVSRQFARNLFGKIIQAKGECAEAIETDDTKRVINCDKYPCDVTAVVLSRPPVEPVVEIWLLAVENCSVMMFAERLNN
jgi:hypothetical protein